MQRIPGSIVSFSLRSGLDLQIAITKILNIPMLADCSEVDRSLICTIASELGSNIVKYADSGLVQIRRYDLPDFSDIEITASDKGPGIPDVDQAMTENYSSGGTLGLGLSGVKRISNKFQILSSPGCGTTVVATKRIRHTLASVNYSRFQDKYSAPTAKEFTHIPHSHKSEEIFTPAVENRFLDIGIRIRCSYGERLSGDQVCVVPMETGCLLAIIDVTGHGANASALANRLARFIKENSTSELLELINLLHKEAENTLGASIGLAFIETRTAQIHYLGLGNTSLLLLSNKNWRPVSRAGVLGMRLPTLLIQTRPFQRDDLLVMFTDGLSETGSVKDLRSIGYKNAESIANYLVDISGKKYDDASCVVVKWIK